MRGLIPFLSSFFCICKPLDLIRSLTHSISSCVGDILTSPPLTPREASTGSFREEDKDEGQEQDEREDERRKKAAAANETERTSTGLETKIPFCIAGDDEEEEEERNAIDEGRESEREISVSALGN